MKNLQQVVRGALQSTSTHVYCRALKGKSKYNINKNGYSKSGVGDSELTSQGKGD